MFIILLFEENEQGTNQIRVDIWAYEDQFACI